MKARLPILVGVALAIAFGAWALVQGDDVARVLPERRDVVLTVPIEGELEATTTERLGPPAVRGIWSFKLSFMAPEGSEVAAGDPVLRFDATDLEQQLMQQTAKRDRAAKELEKRRLDLEKERRAKELERAEADANLRQAELKLAVPADIESPSALRQAEIDRQLVELQLLSIDAALSYQAERARAEIDMLVRKRARAAERAEELAAQIAALAVLAPRAGTVIYVTDGRGEKQKIGDTIWFMSKVVELPDLTSLRANGHVAEADAGRLAAGQIVRMRFDAFPDIIVPGRVESVRRTVQSKPGGNSQEKIVRLEVALDDTDPQRMRPGMRFRGSVEVDRLDAALVVPKQAIFYGAEGAELHLAGFGAPKIVRPTFGVADDDGVAVLSGLEPDAWLMLRDSELPR